ncbi:hypothetical protein Fmac_026370 [Flemingia macrophylla]|uniref:Uncharacterized protein n=1 Tax=Flemingia macrophylla TaxID=520843 RepID=A0ABD1LET5_9FABA
MLAIEIAFCRNWHNIWLEMDTFGPPRETHVFHSSHVSLDFNYSDPPPPPLPHLHQHNHSFPHAYPSTPAAPDYPSCTTVHHMSNHHTPHFPFFSHNAPSATVNHVAATTTTTVHHVSHTTVSNKPTVRVFTKADPNFSLTIRRGEVILAPFDPTNEYQFRTTVKDEEGCPAFSLINKGTGEALKHSIGATHLVI